MTLRGLEEALIVERTREFFEDEVLDDGEAIEMVQRHRADGHHVVTLTSASNYMAELLGEHVPFDGHIATRFEVSDGIFSGEPLGVICFGAGK